MLIIDDHTLQSAQLTADELRYDIAVYLYEKHRLSFGQARKLTGLNVIAFQKLLFDRQVLHHYDIQALEEDFAAISRNQTL